MIILSNIFIIEIGNTKIEQDIKEKREVENSEIKPVITSSYNILHRPVDAQYPEGLNKHIKR